MALNPIAAWHEEHVYFNQLLHLLQREVDVFHAGTRPNYELMFDIVSYLREYSDRFHHPREDEAFARLAKRCPDMELQLARLAQEHRVIAQAGAEPVAFDPTTQLGVPGLLAAAYAQLGQREDARKATAAMLQLKPDCAISTFARLAIHADPRMREHLLDGLRKAGLPE